MILIVGLGNPGIKFKKTRHNAGFLVLDKFKNNNGFSNWKLEKKFKAEISKGFLNRKKIILAKPQTFMNESGKSAKALINNYQLTINDLWVVHDDIDLPLGKMKIVKNRGPAGHKGVQSIIDKLKTKDFIRFRIGIQLQNKIRMGAFGYPEPKARVALFGCEKFVLEEFTKKEEKILKKVIEKTCQAIESSIKQGLEKAMSEYN